MNCLIYFNFLISLSNLINENNLNLSFQEKQNIIYKNGEISVLGFYGPGRIEIYTIIGNQILNEKVRELNSFRLEIKIKSSNIYIVRVFNRKNFKSFKFTVP